MKNKADCNTKNRVVAKNMLGLLTGGCSYIEGVGSKQPEKIKRTTAISY